MGQRMLLLWVIDKAGNIGSGSYSVILDSVAPSVGIEFSADTVDVKVGIYRVTIDVGGIASGLSVTPSIEFVANDRAGIVLELAKVSAGLYVSTLEVTTYTGDGLGQLLFSATDNAGNVSYRVVGERIHISTDINELVFVLSDPDSGDTAYSNDSSVYIVISDDEQAVGWIVKEELVTPGVDSELWVADRPGSYIFKNNVNELKRVYLWIKNANGVISNVAIASINYDTTEPVLGRLRMLHLDSGDIVSSGIVERAGWYVVSVTLNESLRITPELRLVEEGGAYVDVLGLARLSGSEYVATIEIGYDLAVGEYGWYLSATDNAGNVVTNILQRNKPLLGGVQREEGVIGSLELGASARRGDDSYFTILHGLESANAGDTIEVASGRHIGEGNVGIEWVNVDGIELRGHADGSVLDAEQTTRHIFVPQAISLKLSALSLINGQVGTSDTGDNSGGAIKLAAGVIVTIDACILSGNAAYSGGVFGGSGRVRVETTVIKNNTGYNGGVFGALDSELINSLVYGNSGDEGSIYNGGDSLVVNSTIADNEGAIHGGGGTHFGYNSIYIGGFNLDGGDYSGVEVKNSIFSDGELPEGEWDSELIITGAVSGDIFMDYVAGDYRLHYDSLGVNHGSNELWYISSGGIVIDYGGEQRLVDVSIDAGCYEFGGVTVITPASMVLYDLDSINVDYANDIKVGVSIDADSRAGYWLLTEELVTPGSGSSGWLPYKPSDYIFKNRVNGEKVVYLWTKNWYGQVVGSVVSASIIYDDINPVLTSIQINDETNQRLSSIEDRYYLNAGTYNLTLNMGEGLIITPSIWLSGVSGDVLLSLSRASDS